MDDPYPGEAESPAAIFRLAEAYRAAALRLWEERDRAEPLSAIPYRLLAVHAVELYLNAFLLARGHAPEGLRGMQHDLSKRVLAAQQAGLPLRTRMVASAALLTAGREYLQARYVTKAGPGRAPPNQIGALLDEVRTKVSRVVPRG